LKDGFEVCHLSCKNRPFHHLYWVTDERKCTLGFSSCRPSCSGFAEANDLERYRNLRSEGGENL